MRTEEDTKITNACDSCGKSFTEVGEHLNRQVIKVGKTTSILISKS